MPRPFRIDLQKLQQFSEKGMTGVDMARELGVQPPAVSKALKKLGLAKCNVILKAAEKIQRRQLRAEDRILRLDEVTHSTLEDIAKRRLKAVTKEEKVPLEAHLLQFLAEGRKQIVAWADVHQKILLQNELQVFKKTVLEVIEKIDPEVKNEILRRLHEQSVNDSIFGRIEPHI